MRTFQGRFHVSPDYALWYGLSEMQRDLTEIKERTAQMRCSRMEAVVKRADLKPSAPPQKYNPQQLR